MWLACVPEAIVRLGPGCLMVVPPGQHPCRWLPDFFSVRRRSVLGVNEI